MSNPFKKNIFQSILNNVRVEKNLSFRDITVVNNFSEQTTPAKLPVYQHHIPSFSNFVGREQLLEEILEAVSNYRAIAILGISGIGKSAVMARIASCLNLQKVFWYEFQAELAFLDDVLLKLAHFLDNQPESQGNLASIIQHNRLPKQSQIDRIIEPLNQDNYYLFFDSAESISANLEINNFKKIFKN